MNAIRATDKLDKGPAAEINRLSRLGFLKLKGFTGTGFAQPKGGAPMMIRITGSRMVPTGSMWAMGFKVILPKAWAVGSPIL